MGTSDFHVFWFPRALCALGLIWFHSTTAIALLNHDRSTELFDAWKSNQIVATLNSVGPACFDLLFVMSGFFFTMKLVMMMEAERPLSVWRLPLYRCLRFFPMLMCLGIIAFVSGDVVFWSSGSFDFWRVASLFGWQTFANQDWLDFSTTPAWTISVEMAAAFLLTAVVSFLYRPEKSPPTQQLWWLVFFLINVRGYFLATSDPDCLLLECVAPLPAVLPAAGVTFAAELTKMGWVPPSPMTNACPQLCVGPSAEEQFRAYLYRMFLPSFMHFIPFLLGSILFFEYISAYHRVNHPNKRSWSAWSSLLIGPSLIWLLHVHRALPDDLTYFFNLLLPPAFREVFLPLMYAGSWCGVFFCAIVPVAHPAKSFPTTRLLSLPGFRLPARFAFGLAIFHWPVQWFVFRHFSLPLPGNPLLVALFAFSVVLVCTLPVAVGFDLLIDSPWQAFLARSLLKLPPIRSLKDRPGVPPTSTENKKS